MRPAAHMDKLQPTHPIVGRIAVGLQNAFPIIKKLPRPGAVPAELKVKDGFTARPAVLPRVGLMIGASLIMHLHRYDGFIDLQITRCKQVLPHRTGYRLKQLAHPHYPAIQRGTADFQTCFALQYRRLPVQRQVIAILGHQRFHHHPIARQSFFSMIRGASSGVITPLLPHPRQLRFSRLTTRTKKRAGSTSNCSLSS